MAVETPTQAEENPLVEGLERLPVPPTTLVIFGATGDLARRKLLPALYNLAHEGALPERFELDRRRAAREGRRGVPRAGARRRSASSRAASPTPQVLDGLLAHVQYVASTFDDPEGYRGSPRRSTSSTRRPASRSTAATTSRRRRSSSR